MRTLTTRANALQLWLLGMTALAVSLLGTQTPGSAATASVLAGVALLALLTTRHLVHGLSRSTLRVGARSRAHSEPLTHLPAPQHPDTPGRPRSRAPSAISAA